MSVNQPLTTCTPSALTGAPAAIWAAMNDQPGETAATLALAAGIGRSTAGKTLATLENNGMAHRQTGEITNGRRAADRWHPALQNHTSNTEAPPLDNTDNTDAAETATADTAPGDEDHRSGTGNNDERIPPQPAPATCTDTGNRKESEETNAAPETGSPQPSETHPDDAGDTNQADASPSADSAQDTGPGPDKNAAPDAERPAPIAVSGGKQRLAPGALRQMVTNHLHAHPDQAFPATAISQVIGKSSGAIANALLTLAEHGQAEQVTVKPRAYRHLTDATE